MLHMTPSTWSVFDFSVWSMLISCQIFFFFSSRRRHTRSDRDWSSDVCSSDLDLIIQSVKQYKAECVKRYDEIVATARTAMDLKHGFSAVLAGTLRDDAPMHRL